MEWIIIVSVAIVVSVVLIVIIVVVMLCSRRCKRYRDAERRRRQDSWHPAHGIDMPPPYPGPFVMCNSGGDVDTLENHVAVSPQAVAANFPATTFGGGGGTGQSKELTATEEIPPSYQSCRYMTTLLDDKDVHIIENRGYSCDDETCLVGVSGGFDGAVGGGGGGGAVGGACDDDFGGRSSAFEGDGASICGRLQTSVYRSDSPLIEEDHYFPQPFQQPFPPSTLTYLPGVYDPHIYDQTQMADYY